VVGAVASSLDVSTRAAPIEVRVSGRPFRTFVPATAIGIAVTGTLLAALFTGSIVSSDWSAARAAQFETAVTVSGLALTVLAGALVAVGLVRSRKAPGGRAG
jgi:hypothetical protein